MPCSRARTGAAPLRRCRCGAAVRNAWMRLPPLSALPLTPALLGTEVLDAGARPRRQRLTGNDKDTADRILDQRHAPLLRRVAPVARPLQHAAKQPRDGAKDEEKQDGP